MGTRMIYTLIFLLFGVSLLVYTQNTYSIEYDTISYGVYVNITGNDITDVTLIEPTNDSEADWLGRPGGSVQLGVNVYGTNGGYHYYFYNQTGGWSLISSGYILKTNEPHVFETTWNDLNEETNYNWSVNITFDSTGEWWNKTGYWTFSTPVFEPYIELDSINFGVYVNISSEPSPPSWIEYDTISYGVYVNISGDETGFTDYSDYWEFYKLTYSRYDVNADGSVTSGDRTAMWARNGQNDEYLYDVNNDDLVNSGDRTAIWSHHD